MFTFTFPGLLLLLLFQVYFYFYFSRFTFTFTFQGLLFLLLFQLYIYFNRDNLRYQVVPKKSTVTADMAAYIRSHHAGHTGIIYCLSKKECDQLAETLRRERIEAADLLPRPA